MVNHKNTVVILIIIICVLVLIIDKVRIFSVIEGLDDSNGIDDEQPTIQGVEIKSEKASACVQQLLELEKQIVRQREESDRQYTTDSAAWKAARDSAQTTFNNTPTLWTRYCRGQQPECQYDNFFNTIQDTDMKGHDYVERTRLPRSECLELCLLDPKCDIVTHWADDTCWRQTVLKSGTKWGTQPGYMAALRMSDGTWKDFSNARIDGNNAGFPEKPGGANSWQECKDFAQSYGAGAVTYTKDNRRCTPQFKSGIGPGHTINIKNQTVNNPFSDTSQYMKDTVNIPKPNRNDLKYNPSIKYEAIQCQDCSQEFNKVTTQDSSDVDFSQIQNCIMGIEKKEATKAPATPPTTPPTTTPSDTSKPTTSPNTSATTDTSTQSSQGLSPGVIAGIVIGSIVIFISCSIMMYFMMKQ